ncbi:hypothetical protein PMIN03_012878 [Paraphaeosphaeria minitans]
MDPKTVRKYRLNLKAFEMLRGKLTAYLDEMQDFLYDEYDVKISVATLDRELEAMRWSRKAALKAASERYEGLRRAF